MTEEHDEVVPVDLDALETLAKAYNAERVAAHESRVSEAGNSRMPD